MGTIDPSAAREPRDRINYAIGILTERRDLNTLGAFKLMAMWSSDTGMTVCDVSDLLIAEAGAAGGDRSR